MFENEYWLADHCIGAFGVGSIVLKTKAHRENLWELTPEESQSLGDALKTVSGAIVQSLGLSVSMLDYGSISRRIMCILSCSRATRGILKPGG